MGGRSLRRRELGADGIQLAPAQSLDQVAAEADAPALTFRQTLRDQVFGATAQRLAYLRAKAAAADMAFL